MGFRLNRTYSLQFTGSMEGAEVKIRSTSVGDVLRLRATETDEATAAMLSDFLVSWNLEDEDGKPLPTTPEGVMSLEPVVMAAIVREWYKAAVGITAPLDAPSSSGDQSLEESIPMMDA
jgi:hypothetical protein